LATLRDTVAERDKALAKAAAETEQVRAKAEAARNVAVGEIRSLNDQLTEFRTTLAEREKALTTAAGETEQLRAQGEAARHRAEGEIRSLNDQLTMFRATVADRDKALAKALSETKQSREQAEAARQRADGEIRSLNDQLAAAAADRETALANAAMETEQAREQAQQHMQAVVARAEAREASEASRLAAAEAKWRQQSAAALNEATSRYQSAEGMLTQLRLQADRVRTDAVGGSIRSSGATFGANGTFGSRGAQREPEPAPAPPPMPSRTELGLSTQDGKVVLRPNRIMAQHDDHPRRRRRGGRDIAIVAVLAAVVAVGYPRIEPFLPQDVRVAIRGMLDQISSRTGLAVQSSARQGPAVVRAEVNLRSGPSTNAEVIATLPGGLIVTVIDWRGDWMLVQVDGESGSRQTQGWVFGSFLENAPPIRSAVSLRTD
jgi:hypothetical protein